MGEGTCRMSNGRSCAHAFATGWSIPLSDSALLGSDSGSGMPSGSGAWWSSPSSSVWNEAIIDRIGTPCW